MNKKYEIKFLPLFYNDLNKIVDYIINKLNNIKAARDLLDEIENEIEERSYSPDSYEKYNSIRNRKNEYYRIYIKNYVVFYIVKDNVMEVRRILYSRRNFRKLV